MQITMYCKEDGTCPTRDFLDSLDDKMRAKMVRTITLLEHNGYSLREPYSKILTDGIFELRAKQGSNITRVLYFFVIDDKAVLTNGFIKKSAKTPRREIDKAASYREDYLRRAEEVL